MRGSFSAWAGWLLAGTAVATATLAYGWRGTALAVTVVVFWLLLQLSRALRSMGQAARRPIGEVPNAVMFNARLTRGMRLPQVLRLTGSLGRPPCDGMSPRHGTEVFVWLDAGGDAVRVELLHGRVSSWQLVRGAGT